MDFGIEIRRKGELREREKNEIYIKIERGVNKEIDIKIEGVNKERDIKIKRV